MLNKENVVIYTSDREGSSRMNIAHDLRRYMDLKDDQLVTGTNLSKLHGKYVLNLDPDVAPELNRNWRIHTPALVHVFSPNPEEYVVADLVQIMLATAGAGHPLIHPSPYCQEKFFGLARQVFSPSMYREITEFMPRSLYGMSDEFQPLRAPKGTWIAPFNRISQSQKRILEHQYVTDNVVLALRNRGDVPPITNFYMGQGVPEEKQKATYIFHDQPATRAEYVNNARSSGMFICTAKFESFGLMYIELLLSGVVGVFSDDKWNRLLIPDYPWKSSLADLPALTLHVFDHYDEYYEQLVEDIIPGLRERFSWETFASDVFALMEKQL